MELAGQRKSFVKQQDSLLTFWKWTYNYMVYDGWLEPRRIIFEHLHRRFESAENDLKTEVYIVRSTRFIPSGFICDWTSHLVKRNFRVSCAVEWSFCDNDRNASGTSSSTAAIHWIWTGSWNGDAFTCRFTNAGFVKLLFRSLWKTEQSSVVEWCDLMKIDLWKSSRLCRRSISHSKIC